MDAQTEAYMKQVAKEAAKEAVNETLKAIGIDSDDPIEVQQDMAALREARELLSDRNFQADLMHLRKWRLSVENVKSKGVLTAVGLITTGLLGALWLGLKGVVGLGE